MGFGKNLLVEYNNSIAGYIDKISFHPVADSPSWISKDGMLKVDVNVPELEISVTMPDSWGKFDDEIIHICFLKESDVDFANIYDRNKKLFMQIYEYVQMLNVLVTTIFKNDKYWGLAIPKYSELSVICREGATTSGLNTFAKFGRKIDIQTIGRKMNDNASLAFCFGSKLFWGTLYLDDKPVYAATIELFSPEFNIESVSETLMNKALISQLYRKLKNDEIMVLNKKYNIVYGFSLENGLRIIEQNLRFPADFYFRQPYIFKDGDEFVARFFVDNDMQTFPLEAETLTDAVIELAEMISVQDSTVPHSADYNQLFGLNEFVNGTDNEFSRTLYQLFTMKVI